MKEEKCLHAFFYFTDTVFLAELHAFSANDTVGNELQVPDDS